MNFAGHVELARRHLDEVDRTDLTKPALLAYLSGSVLPDLAAMGRFRLVDRPADAALADGIDFHHRSDDLFHRHRWFRTNSGRVSSELERRGLGRGPARACGHVGIELLLDGSLLRSRPELVVAVRGALDEAGDRVEELRPLVEPAARADWADHLRRLGRWPVPDDYHQPAAVAARLQRILSARPRLRFGASQVDLVSQVLADQQRDATTGIDELFRDLLDDLVVEIGQVD